jgi:predicted metal-dependent HD superfamily phosphohydrolase
MQMLFTASVALFSANEQLAQQLWDELQTLYSQKNRAYHNLNHLGDLYKHLLEVKPLVEDWHTLVFAMFYHDAIYNIHSKDNEEKSAELAQKRLTQISYPLDKIQLCQQHILATKTHFNATNNDTNLFTDADLAILGQPEPLYNAYSNQIRKEYAFYPNLIYNMGRKKVLKSFLDMPQIYKTDYFYNAFELQARKNLSNNLAQL